MSFLVVQLQKKSLRKRKQEYKCCFIKHHDDLLYMHCICDFLFVLVDEAHGIIDITIPCVF